MKLVMGGRYKGDPSALPARQVEGAVKFKEIDDMKKLAEFANGLALGILSLCLLAAAARLFFRPGGFSAVKLMPLGWGLIASNITIIFHELLHRLCFRGEVFLYSNLKQGIMFVTGTEDMSKARFVFMSLLPNIVFGLIPFLIFMVQPQLTFFAGLGAACLSMGAGDYYNVFNALTQVPSGAKIFMSGLNSWWYLSGDGLNAENK